MPHHEHSNSESPALSFEDKLIKLLEHWHHHNIDHADNYTNWAKQADAKNQLKVAQILKDVAAMTLAINTHFEKAIDVIKKGEDD